MNVGDAYRKAERVVGGESRPAPSPTAAPTYSHPSYAYGSSGGAGYGYYYQTPPYSIPSYGYPSEAYGYPGAVQPYDQQYQQTSTQVWQPMAPLSTPTGFPTEGKKDEGKDAHMQTTEGLLPMSYSGHELPTT